MVWRLLARASPGWPPPSVLRPVPRDGDLSRAERRGARRLRRARRARDATRDGREAALTEARLTHEILTFPEADHAFFNDTGARYNPTAATQAYPLLLGWFDRYAG